MAPLPAPATSVGTPDRITRNRTGAIEPGPPRLEDQREHEHGRAEPAEHRDRREQAVPHGRHPDQGRRQQRYAAGPFEPPRGRQVAAREQRDGRQQCPAPDRPAGPVAGLARARRQVVGQLRAAMAEHVAEPAWKSLIKRLRRESPEFEARWQRHEVKPMKNLTKRFRHETAGVFNFDYTYLWLGRRSPLRLTSYTLTDDETATKLHRAFP
jgi:hypothetical protein